MQRRIGIALMLGPAVGVLVALFAGGLALGLTQSVGYFPAIGLNDPDLDAYRQVLTQPGFLRSLALTVFVSVVTTAATVVLGFASALALRRRFRGKRIATFVYQLPLTMPYLVVAVGMMMLVSQSGLLSRLMHHAGIIADPSQFPVMVHDDFGVAIILVYMWKQVPFIGLIALAVLQSIGADYEQLARSLGATPWQSVRHVLIPLVAPGLVPASIIIFSFTFGSFEVPFLLGKSFPSMLSVFAYRLYVDVDLAARPQAMATSMFIALCVLVLVYLYRWTTRRTVGGTA
jgi:putative spermidine/putrescine transport system permease protein